MSDKANINTNIDEYTSEELFQILDLDKQSGPYKINKKVNENIERFIDRGETTIINFFKKARDRLIKENIQLRLSA